MREYQKHSDRLRVFTIGKTPEHRSQYILAISSPSNLAHLNEIKDQLGNLIDPRKLKAGPELDQLIQKLPIVLWLSYSVHGSESAAFEAGIQVLYQLLASNDPALREALDHTLILINPCQNPDGHERFTTWYNAHGGGRQEQYAYEHQEPWSITGRLNHNFFDLNRDLISFVTTGIAKRRPEPFLSGIRKFSRIIMAKPKNTSSRLPRFRLIRIYRRKLPSSGWKFLGNRMPVHSTNTPGPISCARSSTFFIPDTGTVGPRCTVPQA